MHNGNIRQRLFELLRNRPKPLTLETISKDTGLSIGWLQHFSRNDTNRDVGLDKAEILWAYLCPEDLAAIFGK